MANAHKIHWKIRGNFNAAPWENILANRVGFGRLASGGQGAALYHVTNTNDSGAGSLRAGAESTNTHWIVFDVSGTITNSTVIKIRSNKTIDGRGQDITLTGAGIEIGTWQTTDDGAIDNIIVHNIKFEDITSNGAIVIAEYASNVWVDHCTFHDAVDEIIYVGSGSPLSGDRPAPYGVTISWNWFPVTTGGSDGNPSPTWGDKSILVSDPGNTMDFAVTITTHHNRFQTYIRHPSAMWCKFHSFNNLYQCTGRSVDAQFHVQFYSENDVVELLPSAANPTIINQDAVGDCDNLKVLNPYLKNGATVEELNAETIFNPSSYYSYTPETADAALEAAIIAGVGWQDVELP